MRDGVGYTVDSYSRKNKETNIKYAAIEPASQPTRDADRPLVRQLAKHTDIYRTADQ